MPGFAWVYPFVIWSSFASGEKMATTSSIHAESLRMAGFATSNRPSSGCAVSPRSKGRPRRRRSRAPAVGQRAIRQIIRSRAARCRHRGPGIRSQSPGWWRAIAGSRRGLACRDADGGPVAVTGDDHGPALASDEGHCGEDRIPVASATPAPNREHSTTDPGETPTRGGVKG